MTNNAGAYPGFHTIKQQGVLLLLLDGMLVHLRQPHSILSGFPDSYQCSSFPLGGERHCESKVSCPRTQHNNLARARTCWTFQFGVVLTTRPPYLPKEFETKENKIQTNDKIEPQHIHPACCDVKFKFVFGLNIITKTCTCSLNE